MSRAVLEAKKTLYPHAKKGEDPDKPKETVRDFVEQIVVAVILAVLIRAFDAEAFVIPTGSMAPTLMGRHKEINCPQCGFVYTVNASDDTEQFIVDRQLHDVGICVNCRFRTVVDGTPSFKGDRILVEKFPYELTGLPGSGGPNRWDVVVFHYPGKPETNYIKRLVGMPGEDLRISHGDIQTRPAGTNQAYQIQRKPMIHQRAMQMLVHDDKYRPTLLEGRPEWQRWQAGPSWKQETPGTYAVDAPLEGEEWADLRYRHVVPDPEQWPVLTKQRKLYDEAIPGVDPSQINPAFYAETWKKVEDSTPLPRPARPTLITDFYSYNTNTSPTYYDRWLPEHDAWLQHNWVGDLTVACKVDIASVEGTGNLKLELIEAGVSNRVEINLITGVATLFHGRTELGKGGTVLRGVGSHQVEFANVDDRLTLLVDGVSPFDDGLTYDDDPLAPHVPNARDLDPVGVAVRGAKAKVSDLVLKRDIYYTEDPSYPDYKPSGVYDNFGVDEGSEFGRIIKMFDFLADPAKFAALKEITTLKPYEIRPDHFMMLGDNSPRSSDSRAWDSKDNQWRIDYRSSWEVPRQMIIGKAFFVYWPHGKPFGPTRGSRDFRFPFRPYFERMKWIR